MALKEFRTYHRRSVTRKSGYHVSGFRSGGECIILQSTQIQTNQENTTFQFYKKNDTFVELFQRQIGILAFGGYIQANDIIDVYCTLSYTHSTGVVSYENMYMKSLEPNLWNSIGFHKIFALNDYDDYLLNNILVEMTIIAPVGTILNFISFDLNVINTKYYQSISEDASFNEKKEIEEFWEFFNQKTSLSIPHIYYLDSELPFETYLVNSDEIFYDGIPVVLKGCNRCSRYLPINIENELHTVAFALHCKKRAPCNHSTFCRYKIDNIDDVSSDVIQYYYDLGILQYYDGQPVIRSYFGHQLECKPCKKYFVNAKLNPMRNTQQFREDALRRRAIEVLVDNLLNKDFIHFEFRKNTKKEFSDYIWNKFGGRCFKCAKKISSSEMHLDHTMPLAYLYRLDETATCLCAEHNSQKSDHFPVDYYTEEELFRLSKITGLSLETLHSRQPNQEVVALLRKNVVWFFDEFLSNSEYQKIRDGKLTADKIYAAIVRVIGKDINLINDYYKITQKYPTTITIQ